MITSVADERIKGLRITDDELIVALVDGRTLSVPLVWYPRLLNASVEQRNDWQLIGDGEGVHWPQIDEDLSAAGMLRGVPAPPIRLSSASAKEIGDRAVRVAKDFYAHSLGHLKGQLQEDRSQLESLVDQIPSEEVQVQVQEMVDSYIATEEAIDQAAEDVGIAEAVGDIAQEAQGAAGQVTQQAQESVGQAASQAQEAARQVAGQALDAAREAAGRRTDEPNATESAWQKAEELGVDLSQLEGSGSQGRITVKDVTKAAKQG